MSNYKVLQVQLDALNTLVGQVGGPIPSEVSDALAAMQAAQAAGDGDAYNAAFNKAVDANKKNGAAWGAVQQWHNQIATQPISGGGDPTNPGDPWTHYPPHFPSNAVIVQTSPGANGGLDAGTVPLNGATHGTVVNRYDWIYYRCDEDGDVASVSSDGVQIALAVSDEPADPGTPTYSNTAESRPYVAGQFVCVKLGEGGYNFERALLFNVIKYA